MPKKVVIAQPKVFEYDREKAQEYVDYNYLQIMQFLRSSINQKHMIPELDNILNGLFAKISRDVREFSGTMVFINKREMIISKIINPGSVSGEPLKFEITYGRIYAGNLLYKIADYFVKVRKESEPPRAIQISFVMEDIIMAIESLPRQNFYATFSGMKNPVE